MFRIGVLTEADDFHAFRIRQALVARGHECRIIEANRLAEHGLLSWSGEGDGPAAVVADSYGQLSRLSELDVVWARRLHAPAIVPDHVRDAEARDVIDRNIAAALDGATLTDFTGSWVSDPRSTRAAELKLLQLRAAAAVGLRVPRTLVSQDPARVRAFCEELNYRVIVKAVAGSRTAPTMTGLVTPEVLTDESVRLCPAIYQELVPGTRHLRVCCFGADVHAALLTSERLDWRYPHDFDAEPRDLDPALELQLLRLLALLDLRMGIFDLKLAGDDAVWLELNPQGQFLFLEAMAGLPLTNSFAEFLIAEAERSGAGVEPTEPWATRPQRF
jgi:hypothetical protein